MELYCFIVNALIFVINDFVVDYGYFFKYYVVLTFQVSILLAVHLVLLKSKYCCSFSYF